MAVCARSDFGLKGMGVFDSSATALWIAKRFNAGVFAHDEVVGKPGQVHGRRRPGTWADSEENSALWPARRDGGRFSEPGAPPAAPPRPWRELFHSRPKLGALFGTQVAPARPAPDTCVVRGFRSAGKTSKQVSDAQPENRPCNQHRNPSHPAHKATDRFGIRPASAARQAFGSTTTFYDDIMKSPNVHRPPDPGTCDGSAGSPAAMSRQPPRRRFQRELQHRKQKESGIMSTVAVVDSVYVVCRWRLAFARSCGPSDSTSAPTKWRATPQSIRWGGLGEELRAATRLP